MTEHQQRLWQDMIDLIQSYLDGQTEDFNDIVSKLEGALDASEIKDNVLVDKWYDFWMLLEMRRAIEGNNIDTYKSKEELKAMKAFLLNSQISSMQ